MFDEEEDRPREDPLERVTSREPADVEKAAHGVFGYSAGKSIIASKLKGHFPTHKTYVEPFCGSAAMFFVKDPADTEVLSDANKDVAFAHQALKSLTKSEFQALGKMNWTGSRSQFEKVRDSSPKDKIGRLYKFLYLARFSYGKMRRSWDPNSEGKTASTVKRIERLQPRYKNAKILHSDYGPVVKQYDGKDTFHFLDPPYAGYNAAVGEKDFDEPAFRKALEGIKGRFLLTYGTKGKLDTSGFEVKRLRQPRTIRTMRGVGGSKNITHLLVSNFKLANKSLGDGIEVDDVMQIVDVDDGGERIMVTGSRTSVSVPEQVAPARAWQSDDTLRAYPEEVGPVAGELRARFVEKACELDLTFPVNDTTIGWTFAVRREGHEGSPAEIAKAFSIEGSRFFLPMTCGVGARETPHEAVATDVVKMGAVQVELGLQTETSHEYFLTKGGELAGQLLVELDPAQLKLGEKYPWIATLIDTKFVPNAVLKGGPMPPAGVSALPASVEQLVPVDLRYWEHTGDQAVLRRDALAVSDFFSPGALALVDGEIARVVTKFALYEPPALEAVAPRDWCLTKAAELADGRKLVEASCYAAFQPGPEALAKVAGDGERTVLYLDAGAAKNGVLGLLAQALALHPGDYIVTAENLPEVRKDLEQLGRPFFFRPDGAGVQALKRLFVASFGVRRDDVCWLDKGEGDGARWLRRRPGEEDCSKGKPTITDEPSEDTADLGKMVDILLKRKGPREMLETIGPPNQWSGAVAAAIGPDNRKAMQAAWDQLSSAEKEKVTAAFHRNFNRKFKVLKADGDGDEEHFVLGVVLEPDEVDSQKDVYSAPEVRAAAHRYMADFQNRGLMHKELVNGKVDILESYLAPVDFTVGSQHVKKGTWLMAVRVKDAGLWRAVKSGGLTGFSIGGSANRQPDPKATSKYEARKDGAQKKIAFQGIPIVIDRPKGFVQRGVDDKGQPWTREYKTDYGYIPRTKGGDGEGLDVFVGPDGESPNAFWAVQKKGDGTFDEYKLFLGYRTIDQAQKAYEQHIPERFLAEMHAGTVQQIKALLNQEPEVSLAKALEMVDGRKAV